MIRPLTLSLALALSPMIAAADGLRVTVTPRTAAEAEALRAGIALYALHRHVESGGRPRDFARTALPAIAGQGDYAAVDQRGRDHRAAVAQRGGGNAHVLVQRGQGTAATIRQRGGEVGLTFLFGW